MKTRVAEALARYGMLDGCRNVTVGLSGGADSCALLGVLCELREETEMNVSACHINHSLRGAESDRDEAFAVSLCERFGVPVEVYRVDVRGSVVKHESIEEAARRLRYECFGKAREKFGSQLATAHTANDTAETVLMNMIRGTGTKGLAGIPPVREGIIRPLILCTREQTENYCREHSIDYVTDSTNLIDDCTRNRIRHKVIPLLEEFNPSFIAAVSRMTEAVGDDESFIAGYALRCAEECRTKDGYDSRKLKTLHPAVLFRVISAELKANGIEPSRLRVSQCAALIDKGMGRVNLCRDKFACVRKKVFFIHTEFQQYKGRIPEK
jgi:tRNA(Ile)-lysidine synthase